MTGCTHDGSAPIPLPPSPQSLSMSAGIDTVDTLSREQWAAQLLTAWNKKVGLSKNYLEYYLKQPVSVCDTDHVYYQVIMQIARAIFQILYETFRWETIPANTRRWPNVWLMLGQRRRRWARNSPPLGQRLVFLRRWPNITPTLGQRLVFAGMGGYSRTRTSYDIS